MSDGKNNVASENDRPATTGASYAPTDCSIALAADWHPLSAIDNFILACGWTHDGHGFIPPAEWVEPIRVSHGYGPHWRREYAVQFCIRYYERASHIPFISNTTEHRTTAMNNLKKEGERECTWTRDGDGGYYARCIDNRVSAPRQPDKDSEGVEHNFTFCPYCGGRLHVSSNGPLHRHPKPGE